MIIRYDKEQDIVYIRFSEKEIVEKIQQRINDIESYKFDAEQAERSGDYGKVAEIRYGRIKDAEKDVVDLKSKLSELQVESAMINEEVGSEEIADIVSRWTGIPVSRMLQSEKEKILHVEDELNISVIGQERATHAVARAIKRNKAGLSDKNRPIGSFLFLGPTGVGKTQTAKTLAKFLFDTEEAMVRIDMSEYMILPHTNPQSTTSSSKIASTCMKCHANIEQVHKKVIKRDLWEKKAGTVPACNDCHSSHIIKAQKAETIISNQVCLKCHDTDKAFKTVNGQKVSLKINKEDFINSAHKNFACNKCHTDVLIDNKSTVRPCLPVKKVDCSICHEAVSDIYINSGHGQAYFSKKSNAPYCTDCHGTHKVLSRYDDLSVTNRASIPKLCGKCHNKNGKAVINTHLKEIDAFSDYSSSVHGKGLMEKGLLASAVCTDCHTSHNILKESDPNSTVNSAHIPATCGACHKSIYHDYISSDHSILKNTDDKKFPTCANCHTAHRVTEIDKDEFLTQITLQCGSCHKKLSETYMETYHGKAYTLGYLKAARCSDCHGAHNILNIANPESSVGQKNIVKTCKKCHKDANVEFTGYLTHATHNDNNVLYYTFWAMTILLFSVFGIFGIHTLLWIPRSIIEARKKKRHAKPQGEVKYFRRFTRSQRITHIFVILSFLLLALTGMMLKFAHMGWANNMAKLIGGVHVAGNIHRFAALITFGYFFFHVISLFKMKREKRLKLIPFIFGRNSLMFNKQDLRDAKATVKWFLGLGERPKYGRWTYWEKFDYMAVFWGVAVIGFSGLILWFPELFTKLLPGWIINVAQIIHSDEALLAVVFIFTIHFFNTHLRPEAFPMDTVIFTGHVEAEEYKIDRPKEWEEMENAGTLDNFVVKKEIKSSWLKVVKFFGYLFLITGLLLVILIIFSLIAGTY